MDNKLEDIIASINNTKDTQIQECMQYVKNTFKHLTPKEVLIHRIYQDLWLKGFSGCNNEELILLGTGNGVYKHPNPEIQALVQNELDTTEYKLKLGRTIFHSLVGVPTHE